MNGRAAERLYALLLRAYPVEFRREYGGEAVRDFGRLYEEARAAGGGAVRRLWRRTVVAVLSAGVRERISGKQERASGGGVVGGGHRRGSPVDGLTRDARLAIRSVRRRPGFAVTVIALVALGVGAATTIFSIVDSVLLRPLPYPSAERLVRLLRGTSTVPVPDFVDVREQVKSFDAVAATWRQTLDLTGAGEPARLHAEQVTPEFFDILGGRAWRGRLFAEDEYHPGAPRVVVLGASLWLERFGADPGVIGRTITLSGQPATIVGVLHPDFLPPQATKRVGVSELYLPLDVTRADAQSRNMYVLRVFARLASGATIAMARAELDALAARLAEQYPESWRTRTGETQQFEMSTLEQATVGDIGGALWMFLGAVGLMLLIACANVANLFLARSTEREQEMAIRAALGAGRRRILAQVLTEAALLALVGGIVGTGLAYLGVEVFRSLDPGSIPRMDEVGVDARILVFAVALSALTGIVFGAVPAWTAARADAGEALREGGLRATTSRRRARFRNALVILQLGLALVLVAGAGVLFHGFLRLRGVEPGFDPEQLLTIQIDVEATVPSERRMAFTDELLANLEAIPRVRVAALTWVLPFDRGRCCWNNRMTDAHAVTDTIVAFLHPVTPGYFRALGGRISAGRDFTAADQDVAPVPSREEAPPPPWLPVVVNRRIADHLWPGQSAVGRTLNPWPETELRVIGVVEPILHWALDAEPGYAVYLPYAAVRTWGGLGLMDIGVRHDGPVAPVAAAARSAIRQLEPDLPINRIASMEERISGSIATPRFYAALLSTFAVLAFLLAAAGVYGSMLYSVGLRRREMGIRLALGAESGDVVRLVVARGAALVFTGTALGLTVAMAATRVLRSLVFEVSVTEPRTFALAAFLLAAAGVLACWLPARRAASVDPVSMLRTE